jgi:ADP-ribosylglycohydrolase
MSETKAELPYLDEPFSNVSLYDEERKLVFNTSRPMTTTEISNKIKGLVYGCVLGNLFPYYNKDTPPDVQFSANQLLMLIEAMLDKEHSCPEKFAMLLKDKVDRNKLSELSSGQKKYLKSLVDNKDYICQPDLTVINNAILCDDNTPLVRALLAGIFVKWEETSIYQCAYTHKSAECIISSFILTGAVRSIMLGNKTNFDILMPDIFQLMFSNGLIRSEEEAKRLFKFSSKKCFSDHKLIDVKGNEKYSYACMAIAMYALGTMVSYNNTTGTITTEASTNFKNILMTIKNEGGSVYANCALAGGLMGVEIGYDNLPTCLLGEIPPTYNKYVDDVVTRFLESFGLISSTPLVVDTPQTDTSTIEDTPQADTSTIEDTPQADTSTIEDTPLTDTPPDLPLTKQSPNTPQADTSTIEDTPQTDTSFDTSTIEDTPQADTSRC